MINTAEAAKEVVANMRYATKGQRSSGGSRVAPYIEGDYRTFADEHLAVIVMIETAEAVQNAEAIMAVDGVVGCFIGPNDLAADLGYLGNWQHPEVWKVMEDAAQRILKAGKAPGILVGEADGRRCLDMGFRFVAVGADVGMLVRGSEALAAKFKA